VWTGTSAGQRSATARRLTCLHAQSLDLFDFQDRFGFLTERMTRRGTSRSVEELERALYHWLTADD